MNKLQYSSSPYLKQHETNPVHWQEWGEEALREAKELNKPLIISVGYAACHWCHVMEHESFTDNEVAKLMNDNFVCIKVDREERPDIDQVYMDAVHLIAGRGGWPMNAFALPDGRPFYAGTYYKKEAWINLLVKITNLYINDYNKVEDYANQVIEGVSAIPFGDFNTKEKVNIDLYEQSIESIIKQVDTKLGGTYGAPKFPMPAIWDALLSGSYFIDNREFQDATFLTLDRMAAGGIFDQIGGGFARYSVDDSWHIPHFEKMLYDNAQLLSLYSKAYKVSKNNRYRDVIYSTIDFIENELTDKLGARYSSINADSEGEEGAFYVFTYNEFCEALESENYELLADYFKVVKTGNWENGKNILLRPLSDIHFAEQKKVDIAELEKTIDNAVNKLYNYRAKRERPTTDNKVITAWNALAVIGYLDVYMAMDDEKILEKALRNLNFLNNTMLLDDNSLYRNFMNGKASINAFLDDYAFLIQANIQAYSTSFEIPYLEKARMITNYVIVHFYNIDKKMFYYTSDISEELITRKYEVSDNVIPSSNSVMAKNLFVLGHYFNDDSYIQIAENMMNVVVEDVRSSGAWYANWNQLLGLMTYHINEVALSGKDAAQRAGDMQQHFLPNTIFAGGEVEYPEIMKNRVDSENQIFVCYQKVCGLPHGSIDDAINEINKNRIPTQ